MRNLKNCPLIFTIAANISFTAFANTESETADDFIPAKIATSPYHTCALSKKGQVKCWGHNGSGELGLGTDTNHGDAPQTMGPDLPMVNFGTNLYAKDICVSPYFTCVATTDGRVKCWGRNESGQLGQERDANIVGDQANEMGDHLPFTNLGADFKVKSLACGEFTNCALSENGKLKCWGSGSFGALGRNIAPKSEIGRVKGEMGDKLPFVALPDTVEHVSMGYAHACAASKSAVYCWGFNRDGQAGIGSTEKQIYLSANPQAATKVKLEEDGVKTVIESLSSGFYHNCALYHLTNHTTEQKVKCWGSNAEGSLGIGSSVDYMGRTPDTLGAKLPETKLALSQIIQLEAHSGFSCALAKNNRMKCWGANYSGVLGAGDTKARGQNANDMGDQLPFVNLGLPILAISSSPHPSLTCAILINNEIKCWGSGRFGQLGYEDTLDRGSQKDDMGENLPYVRFK